MQVNGGSDEHSTDKRHHKITAIVLAAGYGTRLERDIKADTSGKYTDLVGVPKALVPVVGRPLVEYWVEIFKGLGDIIQTVYVVSTAYHYEKFVAWAKRSGFPTENIVSDGSTSNENRRGAIGTLQFFLNEKHITGDILVVAGDTLFSRDFQIDSILDRFFALTSEFEAVALILYYELKDHAEVQKRGILEISPEGRVLSFLEKPSPESTTSNKACPPLYLYSARCHEEFLGQYVSKFRDSLDRMDAPGNFVSWLHPIVPVYATQVSGRFDIGSLADLEEANELYLK